jgi:ubiquitin-protein ligase
MCHDIPNLHDWSPIWTLETVLIGIHSLLNSANPDDPVPEIGSQLKSGRPASSLQFENGLSQVIITTIKLDDLQKLARN